MPGMNFKGHDVFYDATRGNHYAVRDGLLLSINGGFFDGGADSDTVRWAVNPARPEHAGEAEAVAYFQAKGHELKAIA